MEKQRGFSIIELAVTITVLALLMLLGAPSIGLWIDNTRIRNTAESLQTGLQTARQEAVRRNQAVSFYLVSLNDAHTIDNSCAVSSASGSWVVGLATPNNNCGNAALFVAGRAIGDAGGRVRVSGGHSDNAADKTVLGNAAHTVTFNGFGRIADANLAVGLNRIRVTGAENNANYVDLMLIVEPGGGTRMCDPRNALPADDPRRC